MTKSPAPEFLPPLPGEGRGGGKRRIGSQPLVEGRLPPSQPSPGRGRSKTGVKAVKAALDAWFVSRGWKPFKFQREVWKAIAQGQSGLLHATTGAGKTYAVCVLWLTPMRALASDTAKALPRRCATGAHWTPGLRTGDTPSRRAQRGRTAACRRCWSPRPNR
jgi:ATP-dependent Lhr-like helicase